MITLVQLLMTISGYLLFAIPTSQDGKKTAFDSKDYKYFIENVSSKCLTVVLMSELLLYRTVLMERRFSPPSQWTWLSMQACLLHGQSACMCMDYYSSFSRRHPLELTCKSVSKKVNEAIIGATIESEFIKQGDSKLINKQL